MVGPHYWSSFKKTMYYTIGVLAVLGSIWCTTTVTNAQDIARFETMNCVVATAALEGYTGNPHSLEAWNLFSPECE